MYLALWLWLGEVVKLYHWYKFIWQTLFIAQILKLTFFGWHRWGSKQRSKEKLIA